MEPLLAFFHTVHDAGTVALADKLGMSADVLRNKADPKKSSNIVGLADADKVMAITGDFRVLKALAHAHGFLLVKAPDDCRGESDMSVLEQMAGLMVSCGVFGKEVYDSLADGKITPDEIKRVQRAGQGVMTSVAEVGQRLEGMSE